MSTHSWKNIKGLVARILHDVQPDECYTKLSIYYCFSQIFPYKSQKTNKQLFVSIFLPLEGNFDIDAGDGDGGEGGWGDHLGPYKFQKIVRTRIVRTSGTFFQKC